MIFSMSVVNLINLIFIAIGIGVCSLCFLQISSAIHLRKEVKTYFQVFFSLIIIYISAHLARQLMEGIDLSSLNNEELIVLWNMNVIDPNKIFHCLKGS